MNLLHRGCLCLGLLGVISHSALAGGNDQSPLRFIPNKVDIAIVVDQPGRAIDAIYNSPVFQQLQQFEAAKEYYDTTSVRRFYQLVAYFEKELGLKWPQIVEKVAGGGFAIGSKFGQNPAPVLFAMQSRDADLLKKFVNLALEVTEQELARQDSKEKIERSTQNGIETIRIGNDFRAALVGSALLIANKDQALKLGLDLHQKGDKESLAQSPAVAEARKLLPANPLGWIWTSLAAAHQSKEGKELFTLPRNDINLTVLLGGYLDIVGRSPFVCAGVFQDKESFTATIRMPRGTEGMSEALATHVPLGPQKASLPLLEPKGVLFSASYHFDLGKFWEMRTKIFNDKQVKTFEDFDKDSGRFLLGNRFSKLSAQLGSRQRLVATLQNQSVYKTTPEQKIPAFALVLDTREPQFGKNMEGILRGAALLATTQVKLKLVEEEINGVKLVGYRFPDDTPLKGDPTKYLYNFSPCFAQVGSQFVASSTFGLGRELIGLLQKETEQTAKQTGNGKAGSISQIYGQGGADLLLATEDQLLAATILSQALSPDVAKQEVKAFVDWVRKLGVLRTEILYGEKDFRFDVTLKLGK